MSLSQTYLNYPEDLPEKWVELWNDRDAFGLANLFTNDAEFINVVGLWWHNRHDIWKAHDYGLKVIFNKSHLEVRKITKKEVSSDVVIIHTRMKLTGQTSHDGVTQPADRLNIFSFVMKRMEKGWVCMSAHNTDVIPGKETNLLDETGKISAVDYRK